MIDRQDPVVRSGVFTIRPNPMDNVDLVIEDDVGNLFPVNFDELDDLEDVVAKAREWE